jgi:hypothetical protein
MPLSVLKLYSFNDMTIRECGGGGGGPKHLVKTSPKLSPTNPIWPDLGSNQGYGMSFKMFLSF